jgi:hypothetical protein
MLTSQHISEYIICFNSLAPCCDWGNAPLGHCFYDGLLNHFKNKVFQGNGNPKILHLMQQKAQNANARYWEWKAKLAHEHSLGKLEKANDKSSSSNNNMRLSNNNSNNNSGKKYDKKSNKGQKQQNSGKQQQASGLTLKNNLSSKLDSSGKLTHQEHQH